MLMEEYKLFCMEYNEIVESMQKHFAHMINKLYNLGKTLFNHNCAKVKEDGDSTDKYSSKEEEMSFFWSEVTTNT